MENRYNNQSNFNREKRSANEHSGSVLRERMNALNKSRQQQPPPANGQNPLSKKKHAGDQSRWLRAIIMVVITVGISGALAAFILQSAFDMFGLNQEDHFIEVTLPEDPTLSQITSVLNKQGVVEQALTFRLYASLKGDKKYYGGNYAFNTNMGYDEILADLRTGSSDSDVVELYFTEGRNVYEIAKLLEEYKVCEADKFLQHLETAKFEYEFLDRVPSDELRYRKLEGYIFPDTYEFYINENVDEVARKFLKNFNNRLTTAHYERMKTMGMTLDETITLASIIQKETGGVHGLDEMKRVSSVFHNRLNHAETYPQLQSDVTREYVDRFIKPFLSIKNQEMYDAYNTYACDGLSVGPICNPGLDAIEAALYPDETTERPYYFFVTDVQNHFYYAATLDEHNTNVAKAKQVDGEGEIHGTNTN